MKSQHHRFVFLNRDHKLQGLVYGSAKNGAIAWYCYAQWKTINKGNTLPKYELKDENIETYCNNPGCRNNSDIHICKHILALVIERREKYREIENNLPSFMPEKQSEYDHKINKILTIVEENGKQKYLCKWHTGIGENGKIYNYGFGNDLTWQDEVKDQKLLKQYETVLDHMQYIGLKAKYCYV